jgi:hypothetical protein
MLELLFCSMLTILPDYLFRSRQAPGQGDNALFRMVRAAMGHYDLFDAHDRADPRRFL